MKTRFKIAALFFITALAADRLGAQEAQWAEHHSLKQDWWSAGTSILSKTARSPFPLNKTYSQLSPEQAALLKGPYVDMQPGDEPPFPANGMGSLIRSIASAAGTLDVKGPLLAVATIGIDGKPTSVSVLVAPNKAMATVVA